ncbi:hypothetical protein B1C81_07715 [Streptomyces sp. HG99]|nr:hypothetical protein B1C81_07715 [Streptomyces sp. HG99]
METLIENFDNLPGILTVLGIFVILALPGLIGLAHERRIDRQLRASSPAPSPSSPEGPCTTPGPARLRTTAGTS